VAYPTAVNCNGNTPNPPCFVSGTNLTFASRSRHPGGVQVLHCDGTARFIANSVSLTTVWRPLSSSQDGQVIDNY